MPMPRLAMAILAYYGTARTYCDFTGELRFKSDSDLSADVTPQQAWALPEVRAIILPRVKNLLDVVELFLTRIVSARGLPARCRAASPTPDP